MITIYACDQQNLALVEIPLQQSFTGPLSILSDDIASTSCTLSGISGLLEKLNETFETSFSLTPAREALLARCIDSDYDFGTASSFLRSVWNNEDCARALDNLDIRRLRDEQLRRDALQGAHVGRGIPPRRVWDLYSNRVVPYWMIRNEAVCSVSHSWMAEEQRHAIQSLVNAHEWPIPLPIDTTLERIRIELLNILHRRQRHVVWLDVLCLRQQGGPPEKEELRRTEWALDVPTIAVIYRRSPYVIYYYSGLGRPFRVGDLNSDRHWLNRAWTLQETIAVVTRIIGGVDEKSPRGHSNINEDSDEEERKFWDLVDPVSPPWSSDAPDIALLLPEMHRRASSYEIDKICALAHHLVFDPASSTVPAYIVGEDPKSSWTRLVAAIDRLHQKRLLYGYPRPGEDSDNGTGRSWYPSWEQTKRDVPHRIEMFAASRQSASVGDDADADVCCTEGYRLDGCLISGLSKSCNRHSEGIPRRHGTLTWWDKDSTEWSCTIIADHNFPVPDRLYTLIGSEGWSVLNHRLHYYWIVGQADENGRIKKVTVVRTEDNDELKRMLLDIPESECVFV